MASPIWSSWNFLEVSTIILDGMSMNGHWSLKHYVNSSLEIFFKFFFLQTSNSFSVMFVSINIDIDNCLCNPYCHKQLFYAIFIDIQLFYPDLWHALLFLQSLLTYQHTAVLCNSLDLHSCSIQIFIHTDSYFMHLLLIDYT